MAQSALFQSTLHSLPLLARGKVRDIYAVGDDRLLLVATDRISAFDEVLPVPIPGKGRILTAMALFWFARLAHVVPNHLTGEDPCTVVAADEVPQVEGRAMLVRRLEPLPVEAIVRGYLAGSGWKEYRDRGTVCGVALPPGLPQAAALPQPIFTPATKAQQGAHDENIDFDRMRGIVGDARAAAVREVSLRLYAEAAAHAGARGIIIADTKFEFGVIDGKIAVCDEMLTPDSSRFWPAERYAPGGSQPSFDKQFVRDFLESCRWDKNPPAPDLPADVVAGTRARYVEALTILSGHGLR
ncbi:MAG: phosphoribosylaminoimidazolesuccinocarboxamide synthase [Rubrivivax sp.]|nr:phosphoribosylaminoimidazolesuccinocarboxamide synthase [Rubrivivax sp.]